MRNLFFTCKKCGMTVDDGSPVQELCMDCADSYEPPLQEVNNTIQNHSNHLNIIKEFKI